jgi:segregation and condensation protein B
MNDNPPPKPEAISGENAQELSRSYQAVLGNENLATEDGASTTDHEKVVDPRSSLLEPQIVAAPPATKRIVEALLFVGGSPLTGASAASAIRGLTPEQFSEIVDSLNQDYRRQARPYLIRLHDQGYMLELRPRFKPVWEKLYGGMREARLSPAAIDVLALVAYRQPATKQEIESIRGAESGHLLRQLVRRRLIAVAHRGESTQRVVSFGTTDRFLELFALASLDDLPQTQDLQKL